MASILVIDDVPQVRLVLRNILEQSGHAVREARDGAEGVGLFRVERADLVLCDLYMDRKEGMETIQELRRLDPAVRLIALSGDAGLLPVAQALGAHVTLAKPFRRDDLLRCVGEALARPG